MKDFRLDGKKYKIPTTWDDLCLKKFLQIREHEKLQDKMPLLDYNLEFISIITEIPTEDLMTLSTDDITYLIKDIIDVTNKVLELVDEPICTIDGITYVMDRKTDEMKLGQFIDLDLINREGDVWDNAHKICASFMRPAKNTKIGFIKNPKPNCNDYIIDKYDYDELLKNAEIFYNKMPMTYIYTCITFFFTFRQILTRQYEGLFPSTNDGEEVELIDPNEPKTQQQIFSERWSWYSIVRDLANGDLTRFDEITNLPLVMVLNDLSYNKEKSDLEKYLNNNKNNTKTY